jgi:hypothetical protein
MNHTPARPMAEAAITRRVMGLRSHSQATKDPKRRGEFAPPRRQAAGDGVK